MRLLALGSLVWLCVATALLRSDEPIGTSVTFTRDVIRIFEKRCLACHTSGGVAMSLSNYREARMWSRAIREELIEQRMPPWRAAPGYRAFSNDIGLTARERGTLLTWADGGAPRGDDRDLPRRTTGELSARPSYDLTRELPPQRVPLRARLVQRVTIDVEARQAVARVHILPGEKSVLRAAVITAASADGSPRWIGAWTPWLPALALPEGASFRLGKRAQVTVDLHYQGLDREVEDRSRIAFSWAPDGSSPTADVVVTAQAPARAAGARGAPLSGRSVGQARLTDDTRVWAIVPDPASARQAAPAESLEVTARKPDGTVDVLLWIPERRDEWPTPYLLDAPVTLPANTVVRVVSTHPGRVVLSTLSPAGVSGPAR